jgi:aspartate kinase
VDIHVRSSFADEEGTLITAEVAPMEEVVVSGVAYDKSQAKITIADVQDRPGTAAAVFGPLADAGVNVDMIIQSSAADGTNDISFTIGRSDVKKAMPLLEKISGELGGGRISLDDKIAKVSIVGVGMRSHPGVAAKMFRSLAENGINIDMISTSEIKVACTVKDTDGEKAVRILHKAYELGKAKA